MRTRPFFVSHGGEHLAAAVTLPDGEPRGVVLLLFWAPPLGLIGINFWGRAAARLAKRSLATIRFEYAGSGDSTGVVRRWPLFDTGPQADQALAMARVAMSELGFDTFAVAGACLDGQVALQLARDPSCAGAVCIDTPVGEPQALTRLRRRAAGWRAVSLVRSNPTLRRVLFFDRIRRMLGDRPSPQLREALGQALHHARVLMLYNDANMDAKGRGIVDLVDTRSGSPVAGEVRYEHRRGVSLGPRKVDRPQLTAGEESTLDTLTDWLSGCFDERAADRTGPSSVDAALVSGPERLA